MASFSFSCAGDGIPLMHAARYTHADTLGTSLAFILSVEGNWREAAPQCLVLAISEGNDMQDMFISKLWPVFF